MEWINVKDCLPPLNDWILTLGDKFDTSAANSNLMVTKFTDYGCYQILSSGCGCCDDSHANVTHWMPLPDLPNKDEK